MARKISDTKNVVTETKRAPTKDVGVLSKKRLSKESEESSHNVLSKVVIFFCILVIIGLCCGILLSPSFNLSELVIKDGVNVTSAEISNTVSVSYGENIFKQDYNGIKKAVMSLPYIESVKISLSLPNKIKISYVERTPYIILKYLESYFILDKHGYLLEIKKENDSELPILYGVDISSYSLGEVLSDTQGTKFKNVATLLETAKHESFPYTIKEINYESIGDVRIWLDEFDIEIVYGDIDRNQIIDKLNYLVGVLSGLEGKSGKLDISSDNYFKKIIFSERY